MEVMPSSAVAWSHVILDRRMTSENVAVDLTSGNGKDTLFLARRAARVVAFDIQRAAIENTASLLRSQGIENVELVCDSHEYIERYVDPEAVDVFVMNLGYLPKGDKSVTTMWETTKKTVDTILGAMKKGALLSICIYPGHDEGRRESIGLAERIEALNQRDFRVSRIQFPNQRHDPPYWIGIERC
ncbi:MAG: class I SAM-dependent methyltransferase [Peptoniphilus sp.]|nr:class I SAM-dependent methyltransferase [Peptoniphilus sp.]MDD7362924.1 class I SAM-dependent methyltransferase [Bacillota bacterium]MDY6044164.1 class I SAM-dependent methyltransferase [Peptoniphilus sp.]